MNFKLIENVKKYNADYLNVTARLGNCYLIQLWFIGNTNLKTGFTSTSQSLSRFFEIFQMAEKNLALQSMESKSSCQYKKPT